MITVSRTVTPRGSASLDSSAEDALPAVDPRIDHIAGARDADVVVIEYGDFECPYCGAAYPELKRLQHAYAPSLGVDPPLIEDALQERFTADVVRDLQGGLRGGVSGTPSLFINGARHDGAAR